MTQQRVSPITVTSLLPATTTLLVQGALGQSANLQQWQDSAGTVLANITSAGVFAGNIASANGTYAQGGRATIGANTISTLGHLVVFTTNASRIGQVIQGAASQTANLQEWQNSAGTVLVAYDSGGNWVGNGSARIYSNAGKGFFQPSLGGWQANANGAANIPLTVAGSTSQTADLQQWQDSAGTVLAKVDSTGKFSNSSSGQNTLFVTSTTDNDNIAYLRGLSKGVRFGSTTTFAKIQAVDGTNGTTSFQPMVLGGSTVNLETGGVIRMTVDASGNTLISGFTAATVGAIIKGAASQTAALQQWQTSAGTVVAQMTSTGALQATNLASLNNWVFTKEESGGGQIRLKKMTAAAAANRATDFAQLYFRDGTNAGTLKLVVIAGTTGTETTILDNIPQ